MSSTVRSAAGILCYEARMLARRKSLWLAYGALCLVYASAPAMSQLTPARLAEPGESWRLAGQMVFQFNMFIVLVAGILAADALDRDRRAGIHELQSSTPLRRWPYLLSKYLATLAVLLAPYLIWVVFFGAAMTILRGAPLSFVPALLVAFAAIAVPANVFVVALSLACPLFMPVRVYQVLFTGYWFWGNYLSPETFPTLNGTLFTPSGVFAFEAFFGGFRWVRRVALHTPAEAWANFAVLGLTVVAVLILLERTLAWRELRA